LTPGHHESNKIFGLTTVSVLGSIGLVFATRFARFAARFARGDRSEAAAVVPLDMPGFLRSGKNFFPRINPLNNF